MGIIAIDVAPTLSKRKSLVRLFPCCTTCLLPFFGVVPHCCRSCRGEVVLGTSNSRYALVLEITDYVVSVPRVFRVVFVSNQSLV